MASTPGKGFLMRGGGSSLSYKEMKDFFKIKARELIKKDYSG